jgi:uroporphyrinogen decarboxylase
MRIDVLQALQFSAKGMDPRELKRRFGDLLCFEGGVSVQTTLPFGTPEDVRREVEELITVLGKGGGYTYGRPVARGPGRHAAREHRGDV